MIFRLPLRMLFALWMSLTLLPGMEGGPWLHEWAHNEEMAHSHCKHNGEVNFCAEHHYCAFHAITLPSYLGEDKIELSSYVSDNIFLYQSDYICWLFDSQHINTSDRGPPAQATIAG